MDFTYPSTVRFDCNGCGLCCGDTAQKTRHILLLASEMEKIANLTGVPKSDFSKKINGNEPYCSEMKKTTDCKCVFLKDNRCTIYSNRPLICRFYPFKLTYNLDESIHVFDFTLECPAINMGRLFTKRDFQELFDTAKQALP